MTLVVTGAIAGRCRNCDNRRQRRFERDS